MAFTSGIAEASPRSSKPLPLSSPGAPTKVAVAIGDRSLVVTWSKPKAIGSSAILGYAVSLDPPDGSCSARVVKERTCAIEGLTNGRTYGVTVVARNSQGLGPISSPVVQATPSSPPGPPSQIGAVPRPQSEIVSWVAPADPGGTPITGYLVTARPGGVTCVAPSGATSCVVTNLTDGVPYTFEVQARNAAGLGRGDESLDPVSPASPPSEPQNLAGLAGDGSARISWSPPTSDGGSPIQSYLVSAPPGSATCTAATGLSCVLPGLTNATRYTVRVTATNSAGAGLPSTSIRVTPHPVPLGPTSVHVVPAPEALVVSWVAPTSTAAPLVASYVATTSPGGFKCTTSQITCTIRGLIDGTSYSVSVVSVGATDSSWPVASDSLGVPVAPPGAPQTVTVAPGSGSLALSWKPPVSDGGTVITGYSATLSPGLKGCTTTDTSCTITGLDPTVAVSVQIVATNAVGSGPPSLPSRSLRPATVPAGPSQPTVTTSSRSAVVTWVAPADSGGSPITGYQVASTPRGGTCQTVAPVASCSITTLTNGTTYTFSVRALNEFGLGGASLPSASGTPAGLPSAPTGVTVDRRIGGGVVTFTAPSDGGGSPIIRYVVTVTPGGATCKAAVPTCVITGLDPGGTYSATVVAENAVGTGPGSIPSKAFAPDAITSVATAASGEGSTCAVLASGRVLCWGGNTAGQLGTGDQTSSWSPRLVKNLSNVASISVGPMSACAVDTSHVAWCWGTEGLLGKDYAASSFVPVSSNAGKNVAAVSIGAIEGCKLSLAGDVSCWGFNGYQGFTASPTTVSGLGTGVQQVAVGDSFACAVTSGATVMCWGDNSYGQLGDGSTVSSDAPVAVSGLSAVNSIAVGGSTACAIFTPHFSNAVRHVVCWGQGDSGQIGNGRLTSASTPQAVPGMSQALTLSVGQDHVCGLSATSAPLCWGANWAGQLGIGTTVNARQPHLIPGLTRAAQISAGGAATCAALTNGMASCWGNNRSGQLGQSGWWNVLVPVSIGGFDG